MSSTVAVLGGGISGLSTAYYLARLAKPSTKILLVEGKDRVGGWIQSRRVAPGHYLKGVDDATASTPSTEKDAAVLFEAGPRSLRPEGANGAILLEMASIMSKLSISTFSQKKKKTNPPLAYIIDSTLEIT